MTSFPRPIALHPVPALLCLLGLLSPAQGRLVALDSSRVSQVWSGHPVDFALLERGDTVYTAYYAAEPDRQLTVARRLPSGAWTKKELNTAVGWDSHNYVTMLFDGEGHLHVSGNMHGVPLIYYRAASPGDIASLARVSSMVGNRESSVTYPVFLRGPKGEFLFMYRDGGSGNGDQIVNAYNLASRTWSRLLSSPLFDGQDQRSAYLGSPSAGPVTGPGDGFYHLFWFWRSTPDASTTHQVNYIRSRDLVSWESGAGTSVSLPVTFGAARVTVDPVPEQGGLINRGQIGFDALRRPIITYHKHESAEGATQLYNARLENGAWKIYKSTDWTYRWNFGGGGSLVLEIEFGPVILEPGGALTQWYRHAKHGRGVLVLNPSTLHADSVRPDAYWPAGLDAPRRSGMEVSWLQVRSKADPAIVYALRWETLPTNQDRPRAEIPAPTELMWYKLRDPDLNPVGIARTPAARKTADRATPRADLLGRQVVPSVRPASGMRVPAIGTSPMLP